MKTSGTKHKIKVGKTTGVTLPKNFGKMRGEKKQKVVKKPEKLGFDTRYPSNFSVTDRILANQFEMANKINEIIDYYQPL